MFRYVPAWIPMVVIAVLNGLIREAWYGKYMSEVHAHQVSTLTAVLLFGIYIWKLIDKWRPDSSAQAMSIGFVWLALTVVFEFLFGRYVVGKSWSELFKDYNISAGRIWVLILIWITVAPYLFYRLRGKKKL